MYDAVGRVLGLALVSWIAWLFGNRKALIARVKQKLPQNIRVKQLITLLVMAGWFSACCLYEADS